MCPRSDVFPEFAIGAVRARKRSLRFRQSVESFARPLCSVRTVDESPRMVSVHYLRPSGQSRASGAVIRGRGRDDPSADAHGLPQKRNPNPALGFYR